MSNKKIYRPKQNRKLCGVCQGVSEYLGIDVIAVRILWVLGTWALIGTGLILYIACVFIIPEEDDMIEADYTEK